VTSGRVLRALLVFALAPLATLLLAAAPAAPPEGGPSGFHVPAPARTVLKNGLTVLVLERHAIPLVQIQLMVKSGSAADPAGREGTASLTARLLRRGTKTRPAGQFFEEVEFVGGTLDTVATVDATYVLGEFAARDIEVGFNLLADLIQNPAFRQEEFDKEKGLALADIVGRLDDPETVARLAFDSWLYGTHPYGHPVDGVERTLSRITRDDVTGFFEARYAPNDSVLAIVGDVDGAQAAQRADRYFSPWRRRTVPEVKVPEAAAVRGRKVLLVDKPDATQSQICFGNVGIRRSDPDYFPTLVGGTVLGGGFSSWLVNEVRVKRGLTYSIASRVEALRATGSISVATFSKNPTVVETIKVSLDQIRRVRGGDLPGVDLETSKSYLAGLYPLRIESPENLAREMLRGDLYGLDADSINLYQKRVRAVTADAVKKAAARRLPLDDLAIVVVGPAAALAKDLQALGPITVRPLKTALEGTDTAPPRAH
jgi:zinc protease